MADSSSVSELKNLVRNFRVTELSALLAFAGRDKHGRKNELRERALALCNRSTTSSIVFKIHELNRARLLAMGLPIPPSGSSTIGFDRTNEPPNKLTKQSTLPLASTSLTSIPGAAAAAASRSPHASLVPVHPDVKFKRLPFYDFKCELLKPSSLAVRNMGRFQESSFNFFFTPQQAREIDRSRYIANELIEEFGIQVLIRFCLAETTCDQQDMFPSSICVRVNNKVVQLPTPIPTNKPGVEPKRPGRPVDITHSCKLVSTEPNRIDISWATDNIRNFCVGVTLESRLNSDILIQRLKSRGNKHPDHTRALIKEKLAASGDAEIATTSLRCSLLCPLGKMRMLVPARSTQCNHLQCFDAKTYIQMNEKKSTWFCPICDQPAEFPNLFIDGLFLDILRYTSDTDDIEFSANGHWAPYRVKADDTNKIDDSVLVQALDDEVTGPFNEGGSCIDLTESDDEEGGEVSAGSASPNTPSCSSAYSLSSDSTVIGFDYSTQPSTSTSGSSMSQSTDLTYKSHQQPNGDDEGPPCLEPYWGDPTDTTAGISAVYNSSLASSSRQSKSSSLTDLQTSASDARIISASRSETLKLNVTTRVCSPSTFSDESSLSSPINPLRDRDTPDVISIDSE